MGDTDAGPESGGQDRIAERFIELLETALIDGSNPSPGIRFLEHWEGPVHTFEFSRWLTSVTNLVSRVFGPDSLHRQRLEECQQACREPREVHWVHIAQGVFRAAYDDYVGGWNAQVRELVAGEVFTDFLDMTQHLLKNRFHVPAASLAGAVLEDALRRLHARHIGEWEGESKISRLNDALRKADVYPQPVWREIQSWADIRNNADHGCFGDVDGQQVKRMMDGIGAFIAKYLT